MPPSTKPDGNGRAGKEERGSFSAPTIELPKGGGAIKGIGEKFGVNPVNGTGSLTVPIFTSPGRSKFSPNLSLSYDSGSGNGPFGFGWHLSVPNITRKTDKGLPRYIDAEESDVFILSEAEDLVPTLLRIGEKWQRDTFSASHSGSAYTVQRYRPRIEGLFARIERWTNNSTGETFWRSISKDNVTSLYGVDASSRIADPADPLRVFTWLLSSTFDDRGNVAVYEYKSEDAANVPQALYEQNRQITANRYLKRIKYCNRTPYYPKENPTLPSDWCFEAVFDYGDHDLASPRPVEDKAWRCRPDPFSRYRSGFEVRTYRICSRVLMFHHFPEELGTSDYLVRSTNLAFSTDIQAPDSLSPIYSYLKSVRQVGYLRENNGSYRSKSMPPLEFTYTQAEVDETIHFAARDSLENMPEGVDGSRYQFVDLDGEGSVGILTEQGGAWFYKRNLSSLPLSDGTVAARFAPVELVGSIPSIANLRGGGQQLMDLAGDGHLCLVEFSGQSPGFYERDDEGRWDAFTAFDSLPNIDWKNPNLRTVDLDGDGFADILITENEVITWYPSRAKEGYSSAESVHKPFDEDKGPALVFADGTQSIYLADASGGGLKDLVRIRNGEVCYWPNIGFGRFGAKITMDDSPVFDTPDQFDQKRVRLADIDGTGTTDLIYLGRDKVTVWFNQSGNSWTAPQEIPQFPATDDIDSVSVVDLLGNGTACLVWSSPLPGDSWRPFRYIDLMGGQKPHLLVGVKNNLGAETRVQYAPSTKFYVADRLAGKPWVTRLAFPVHVVERVETLDHISRNRFVARYGYHHGYFDGDEREFRGFGMVEQWDTEELAALKESGILPDVINTDESSYVPPSYTKTWFHTGAYIEEGRISRHFDHEYYREGDAVKGLAGLTKAQFEAMHLPDTVLPEAIKLKDGLSLDWLLSGEEVREACRALKGSVLRREIYALDGSEAANRPYSVTEQNYTIEILQPRESQRHAVYFTHARESVDYHYERKLYPVLNGYLVVDPKLADDPNVQRLADPRVTHTVTLDVDAYGNVLKSVAIGYGRRFGPATLRPEQLDVAVNPSTFRHPEQHQTLVTLTENRFTNAVDDPKEPDAYRTPLPCEARSYEVLKLSPNKPLVPNITNLFRFDGLKSQLSFPTDSTRDISFEDSQGKTASGAGPYRRMLEWARTLYRSDDLASLLPLGRMDSHALAGETYRLALTTGLLRQTYQRPLNDIDPLDARPPETLMTDIAVVLGGTGPDQGGYVDLDANGNWWVPSGRVFYDSAPNATAAHELAEASRHFYLPRRFRDPFGQNTFVTYDSTDLLIAETADAVGNTVHSENDYRVLHPRLLTDPNGNRTEVVFDALGMVAGSAVMGKAPQNQGDSLIGFSADLKDADLSIFLADPLSSATSLLSSASTRILYDLERFTRERKSPFAATLDRETHLSDLPPGQPSKIQIRFSYSDGFGREIQKKIHAEPGPLDLDTPGAPVVNPRWVGSGWTIFNNKGKEVRLYEPFFSATHDFEFARQVGVSPVLFNDPLDRVVATLHPNHSYEKVLFDPWQQESWDINDTVLLDPSKDDDVKEFFHRLPPRDYQPTWYRLRTDEGEAAHHWPGETPGIQALRKWERSAASKTEAHAGTPMQTFFDALGRGILTVAYNRRLKTDPDEYYTTRTLLDIQGNQREVIDAKSRVVIRYDYDFLKVRIHQASMEAGERWMLMDASNRLIRLWDSRGHNFRMDYDELRRPVRSWVRGTDAKQSDPRVFNQDVLYLKTVYGESLGDALNHRTRVYQICDPAGVILNLGYDFKGNLLRSARQLAADYKQTPDWSQSPALENELFATSSTFDALNRHLTLTTPDGSVTRPAYNEANLLERVDVNLHGAAVATPFVTNIDYNAKGQRVLIEYGILDANQASQVNTMYSYDPQMFRLLDLTTTRKSDGALLQDMKYYYDPCGNITHIHDAADIQNVVYFRNKRVEPSADYVYDAVYRLIRAIGREHLGQIGTVPNALTPQSYNDWPRINLPHPNDGNAMGTYIENFLYDPAGNFLQLQHIGSDPASPGWTRDYACNESSVLEPHIQSNRLSKTTVGSVAETYPHDSHGNMTAMPHLFAMAWDFKDQLQMTQRQAVNNDDADGVQHQGERTYYVYDFSGQRVRKVTESSVGVRLKGRMYLGGCEIYREDNISLERQTLHVMDDKRRIALVENLTQGGDGSPPQLIRYQFSNHLGSACLELDGAAQIISYEEYYPYGSTSYLAVEKNIRAAKMYRYTGKERDEESGLSYHDRRYYGMWLGVWINCDPTGIEAGNNLYCYCKGRPIIGRDVTGTDIKIINPPMQSGIVTPQQRQEFSLDDQKAFVNRFQADFRELFGVDVVKTENLVPNAEGSTVTTLRLADQNNDKVVNLEDLNIAMARLEKTIATNTRGNNDEASKARALARSFLYTLLPENTFEVTLKDEPGIGTAQPKVRTCKENLPAIACTFSSNPEASIDPVRSTKGSYVPDPPHDRGRSSLPPRFNQHKASLVMGPVMVAIHEFVHNTQGKTDPKTAEDVAKMGKAGPTVETLNPLEHALGLPRRLEYSITSPRYHMEPGGMQMDEDINFEGGVFRYTHP